MQLHALGVLDILSKSLVDDMQFLLRRLLRSGWLALQNRNVDWCCLRRGAEFLLHFDAVELKIGRCPAKRRLLAIDVADIHEACVELRVLARLHRLVHLHLHLQELLLLWREVRLCVLDVEIWKAVVHDNVSS